LIKSYIFRLLLLLVLNAISVASASSNANSNATIAPQSTNRVLLTAAETKRVLSHGPWPLPVTSDSGNAYSQNIAVQRFGKKLFFDRRLSSNGLVSCASCHAPTKAFSDGLTISKSSVSEETLGRNSPSLLNAVHERWYGWDGASDSIWSQSLRPLFDRREMGLTPEKLRALLVKDDKLATAYAKLFPDPVLADDDAIAVNIAKSIAAYVSTLTSGKTSFDVFRDSLEKGDLRAAGRYPKTAQRGLQIFIGKGQCSTCHVGPMFSNGEFGDIGVPFFIKPGVADEGRYGGIIALKKSAYNLLSKFSSASNSDKVKVLYVDAQHRNFGEFKVPSLRNVAQTAPYMHNGSVASLEAVVTHYSELNADRLHADGDQILKPLNLNDQEKRDLVAFLRSLSIKR
jgi:cytochrome c peroxidase